MSGGPLGASARISGQRQGPSSGPGSGPRSGQTSGQTSGTAAAPAAAPESRTLAVAAAAGSRLLLAAALLAGCSPAPSPYASLAAGFSGTAARDTRELNGLSVNSVRVRAMSAAGQRADGRTFRFAPLADGRIAAVSDDGLVVLSPAEVSGATLTARLEDGSAAKYRIDSMDLDAVPGVPLYLLSYFDGSVFSPACGTDSAGYYAPAGAPIPALALSDTWSLQSGRTQPDATAVTFSCVSAALGTCVIWGYKRWTRQTECLSPNDRSICNDQDLSYAHQACTRLVRADYCGTGFPHTVGGTSLAVYDPFSLRSRPEAAGLSLEAEWRSDGAHCVRFTRFTKADAAQDPMYATDSDYIADVCPVRLAQNDASCADPATSHFFTQYGFSDPLPQRSILRSEAAPP